MEKSHSDYYDIAIVGGGIAGIYTAWRLMKADTEDPTALKQWKKGDKLKIAVFEGGKTTGGRLVSATPPGFKGMKMVCELGGMRFVSSQKIVSSLILNELTELRHHEQDVTEPINIINLRTKLLRNYQLNDPSVLPYWFSEEEKKALLNAETTADNFIGWAVEKILPEIAERKLSGDKLQEFLQVKKVDGVPLYQHGFWNLLSKVLSNEGREIAIKTVGYDILGGNCNAVNCISEYFDFTPGVKYYLLDEGYDAVPWTLQKQFEDMGGEVWTGHWLHCFDETTLKDGSKGVTLNINKHDESLVAGALILAMPRRSLELLSPQGPLLDPERFPRMAFLMNSVSPIPLYKMCLVYDDPWWEKQFVTKGRSVTDLPVRQLYYWGVDVDADGNRGNAVLMAYNDMESSVYWGGFRTNPLGPEDAADWQEAADEHGAPLHIKYHSNAPKFERTNNKPNTHTHVLPDGKAPTWNELRRNNWEIHEAPSDMVKEMHKQIMQMHGIKHAPEPIDAAFIDWADDPFGGAVHFWNTGYKSWEIMQEMTKPVSDFPCYICGEAWSENQTWVEGSLQTSEIVLQKHFKLSPPKWMKDGK